ncbi:MAG: aldo/keto reductase, partial [Planctomycetales bacterium]
GLSEQRIGRCLANRRDEFIISTKVGEQFHDGTSDYDFSETAIRDSISQSLKRLQTEVLDIVFVHSNGDDLNILNNTDVVSTLDQLRQQGVIRAIGFSGFDPVAERQSLQWADALMVEYDLTDATHEEVIQAAGEANVGVVIKKGLASGTLKPSDAIKFILKNQHVDTIVVGGLNLCHFQENCSVAEQVRGSRT